ncbi:unnamed protein product [Pneumocystis jirovecii]|uniref:Uncharacterized protein n=2 Tax=Pneumocystis jirovecii TaxID=42068 RepID=L0P8N5_PNEJI|nr:uncharacterized protein T551_01091 [Pneumocystis jirovecii RU7]KTW31830.1 hypothetical protein T551_01091 [Pneumocystis jirovecii RU7]CCJ28434.1 unnamed protein product [Pneumocystis jirovecii]
MENKLTNISDEQYNQEISFLQRMRALKFYKFVSRCYKPVTFYLWNEKYLSASHFLGTDALETKFCVKDLQTDWGIYKRAVIRSGDTISIKFPLELLEEGEI